MQPEAHRVIPAIELQQLVAQWRSEGLRIGFTCGAFDLLHAGHVNYLEQAKTLCDRLVVAVNSDESVRAYKSPLRPVVAEHHRAFLVAALRCVDAVTIMQDLRPSRLIEVLRPDFYIKGGDYTVSQLRSAKLVESYGGRCFVIPVEHEVSTSALIKRIEDFALYSLPEKLPKTTSSPLILLDRDGTIIENEHFLHDPTKVRLLSGAGEGLRTLQDRGCRLVVVTNQQGIGLGYFDYAAFVAVNSEMLRQLSQFGVAMSKFYFCPHSASDNCRCRKPGSLLIERALSDFNAAPTDCFFIGDSLSDMQAAHAAGCHGVLLSSGGTPTWMDTVSSFTDAVQLVLSRQLATA
jgi:rfaE bifunctional protein nucleotidyltransferase chain/domain